MWKMTEPSYVVTNKANSHLVFLKFFDQIHIAGKLRTNSGNAHDDSVKKKHTHNSYIFRIDYLLILLFKKIMVAN